MNERIAEFRKQCIVREQRGTNAFDSYMVDRFDTEKFAELIILECAKVVLEDPEKTGVRMYFDEKIAAYVIKKHFGM